MDENNMTAAEQTAPAAAQTEATVEAAEQTVTVGALRGAIERRQEQNMRRAAEQTAARWSREADELTAQCPDFDLGAALKDDRFCALLRTGIDVRTAWFALHAQALLETACLRAGRSAEQRVAEHIRARGLRPAENGLGSGGVGPSFRFRDVPAPSNWAHEGIDYCVRHGLMSGFDATTFSPDTVSTRAQIVMILYNLSGDTTDYSKYYVPFTDVRPSTWYYNAVAWGYDKDIVAGMSTTTFAPDGLITREQMAVLLYGYTEKYAPAYLGGAASLNGFPDAASVSNWAYAAMSWAVGNGLISGIASNGADYLAPSGGATRAQIAAIMMRYCRLTGL